jgi:hypothetical protein
MCNFVYLHAIWAFGCIAVVGLFRLKLGEKDMSQSGFESEIS